MTKDKDATLILFCGLCKKKEAIVDPEIDVQRAVATAHERGWRLFKGKVTCPSCATGLT